MSKWLTTTDFTNIEKLTAQSAADFRQLVQSVRVGVALNVT